MNDQNIENNAYNIYSETPRISAKNRKRLTVAAIIICICVAIPMIHGLLIFLEVLFELGFITYPKWYLVSSFYLNKSSFEYIRDSGESFTNIRFREYDFDGCSDEELARSIKKVSRVHLGDASWYHWQDGDVLIFRTDNYAGLGNTRGILYYENEIDEFDDFYYRCRCKPLGDSWYYYYAYRKGSYYDEG